jgi:predicted Zn-dependent protease
VLKGLLARPCGPDKVRSSLQTWLVDAELMAPDAKGSMWTKGKVRDIQYHAFRIVTTPTEDDLPDKDAMRYARAVEYQSQGKPGKAATELEALLVSHPNHPRILANLAILQLNLKRSLLEVEALAKRAYEIDPDYVFARVALAHVLIRKGQPEDALKMLAPILEREEIHLLEWRACLVAQMLAAQSMGDAAAAKRLSGMLAERKRCSTMTDGTESVMAKV